MLVTLLWWIPSKGWDDHWKTTVQGLKFWLPLHWKCYSLWKLSTVPHHHIFPIQPANFYWRSWVQGPHAATIMKSIIQLLHLHYNLDWTTPTSNSTFLWSLTCCAHKILIPQNCPPLRVTDNINHHYLCISQNCKTWYWARCWDHLPIKVMRTPNYCH